MQADSPAAPAAGSLPHRPDIDGLRALAVLAVMLFHLEVPGFAGGFTGVDVFFVISGFLITRLLLQGIARGDFTPGGFYRRRVLRILPAFVVVSLACAAAGWMLLLPSEAVRLGQALVASALMASNMFFIGMDGYQDAVSMQQPLLHTWSLAVEEQYYLAFPWLLAWLAIRWPGRIAACLAVLAVASWLFALGVESRSPNAAFLLGPARAWELLLGALLALPPVASLRLRPPVAGSLGVAGALLIGLAICGYGWFPMPVPVQVFLLAPCAGAALLIVAGSHAGGIATRLLSLRPAVLVGLISYSLYLWHWPLVVFYRAARPFTPGIELFVLPASFLLALLSWRWVEQPLRRSDASPRDVFTAAAAATALLVLAGLSLAGLQGGAGRWDARVRQLDAFTAYRDPQGVREDLCFLTPRRIDASRLDHGLCLAGSGGKPNVLLVGDSHAAHLWPGLSSELPQLVVQQATASGCRPVVAEGGGDCGAFMRAVLGMHVLKERPDTVILASRWGDTDPQVLRATVEVLLRSVRRVIVIGPAVEYRDALPRLLALSEWHKDPSLPQRARRSEVAALDGRLASALAGSGAIYVSLYALMCDGGPCRTLTPTGVPLQFDYGHFTREGARWVADRIRPVLDQ